MSLGVSFLFSVSKINRKKGKSRIAPGVTQQRHLFPFQEVRDTW
jgi:hypothetical protein